MANRTRTRLYTRWRSTLVPGHVTNDRESHTVHRPTRPTREAVRQGHGRVEPVGETRPLNMEELGSLLTSRGFRVTKLKEK